MASYKVPQDVEADDKLLGPFTFRQFIYLVIVVLAGFAAWGLGQIFIGLAIIPLPVILLFGALALPLRKDQPMEIYLAALVSFYLKPHRRLWHPDGVESLIEITVPKAVEEQRVKNITQDDADQRFSYLANLIDSQGWAIGGSAVQQTQDVFDDNSSVVRSFEAMMNQRADQVRESAIGMMHPDEPAYDPYPANIQQAVIQPIDDTAHQVKPTPPPQVEPTTANPQPATSDEPVSAGIMNLVNNPDLSIETIAHEANRIQKKEDDLQEEVVVSLR